MDIDYLTVRQAFDNGSLRFYWPAYYLIFVPDFTYKVRMTKVGKFYELYVRKTKASTPKHNRLILNIRATFCRLFWTVLTTFCKYFRGNLATFCKFAD